MASTIMHQKTPITVSNTAYRRKAHQARSDFLAESVVALRRSIREAIMAYGNRFKVRG